MINYGACLRFYPPLSPPCDKRYRASRPRTARCSLHSHPRLEPWVLRTSMSDARTPSGPCLGGDIHDHRYLLGNHLNQLQSQLALPAGMHLAEWSRCSAAIYPATLRLCQPRGGVAGSALKMPERLSTLKKLTDHSGGLDLIFVASNQLSVLNTCLTPFLHINRSVLKFFPAESALAS